MRDISSNNDELLFDQIADALVDSGYIILPLVLSADLLQGLIDRFDSLTDADFKRAGIGRLDDFQLDTSVRRDRIHWLQEDDPAEIAYLTWMERLRAGLNRRLFMGLVDYECHYASYEVGAFYKKHFDVFKPPPAIVQVPMQVSPLQLQTNRAVSTVLYLNPDWSPDDGGELLIFDEEDQDLLLAKISPEYGKLVLFLSEKFPHEVAVAKRQRHSLAGWFRVNAMG